MHDRVSLQSANDGMRLVLTIIYLSLTVGVFAQHVIFREDFEESSLPEMVARWDHARNIEGMFFSEDFPPGSRGRQSLAMTYVAGQNTGGHLYKSFPQGYDSLYIRFYTRFSKHHSRVHHFVHMGGYNPPTRWPQGTAGYRPVGNDHFTSGIEPVGDRWSWDFYTYWMHMRGYADPRHFWGNTFHPEPPAPVRKKKWICVEMMMKLNEPISAFNGEQAFWIDGKKVLDMGEGFPNGYWVWDKFYPDSDSTAFEGFQWRYDDSLKINFFWLLYYMTDGKPGVTDTVWFDDIVISDGYNGPLKR